MGSCNAGLEAAAEAGGTVDRLQQTSGLLHDRRGHQDRAQAFASKHKEGDQDHTMGAICAESGAIDRRSWNAGLHHLYSECASDAGMDHEDTGEDD